MRAVVVGAGIVGASAAFHLARRGVEVDLVDSHAPGRATLAGAGIVCPWLSQSRDPRYETLAFAAVRYYPELVARLTAAGETGVDCAVVGGLVVAPARDQLQAVARRLQGYLDRGVTEVGQVRLLDAGGPKALFPHLDSTLAGLYLSGAIRVSGESLRVAMLNAAVKAGARQRFGTATLERNGSTAGVGVRVAGELLRADVVVVAAGAWSAELCRPLDVHLEVEPQRGQILHLRVEETSTATWPLIVPVLSEYYLLGFDAGRVVMGATRESGSGFDFRITAGGVAEVLQEGLRIAPGLKRATLTEIRVGFRPMTRDGLPLLGRPRSMPGLVIATGLGRYGLTVGPYVGLLAAQLATGETPQLDVACFDPERRVAAC
ncbi:MAG: FAD-binding oxidoreductase [Verrucomicrobia bacterium]|nr:FAD-binding oxidoreductase [Verrucomicrobiota bacterium]